MSKLSLLRRDSFPSISAFDYLTKDFDGVFKEMDKVFVPFKKNFEGLWSAPSDIHETDVAYFLNLDLPGMKKEDIHIEVTGNQVSIFGERKYENKEDNAKTHRLECWKGEFRRSFTLPDGVQSHKVEANYEDGVLKVTIPKAESSAPKKISVK